MTLVTGVWQEQFGGLSEAVRKLGISCECCGGRGCNACSMWHPTMISGQTLRRSQFENFLRQLEDVGLSNSQERIVGKPASCDCRKSYRIPDHRFYEEFGFECEKDKMGDECFNDFEESEGDGLTVFLRIASFQCPGT